jgi:uncharacterized protein (TIGR03086 family)
MTNTTSTTTTTSTNATRPNRYGSATVTFPSDLEILITRVFDAPAALVFRAWTTPDLVRRWWGDETSPLVVCDIDLRVGGSWRYVTSDSHGTEMGWHGTYGRIDAPHNIVSTEVFEGYPDGGAMNTMVLNEHDGTTTMSVTVLHRSRENRDGHVESGMEHGLQKSLNRIEDLLDTIGSSPEPGTVAARYRTVGGRFTETVRAVPADAWDNAAPCEGWVARDVVRHLVGWVPDLLRVGAGIELPHGPLVDDDPVGAWMTLHDAVRGLLDDPGTAGLTFSHPQAGTHPLDQAIGMFIMGDVLIHTWDIARATGLDETLDPTEVAGMYAGMLALDEMLRASGQYGQRVDVPADADLQTKLIAFTGRQP